MKREEREEWNSELLVRSHNHTYLSLSQESRRRSIQRLKSMYIDCDSVRHPVVDQDREFSAGHGSRVIVPRHAFEAINQG